MDLPFDDLLSTLTGSEDAQSGWRACCDTLHTTAPSPIWAALRELDAQADVDACAIWLKEQLSDASTFLAEVDDGAPRGIVLWLAPQALADDEGWCVEIGATAECVPTQDSLDWIERCAWVGDFHLMDGIVAAEKQWLLPAFAKSRDLAEYACFLFYAGLVLRHALPNAGLVHPWLAGWGFFEGDRGLLMRGDGLTVQPLGLLA